MRLFESAAHRPTCPDCGAPLQAASDDPGAESQALPHDCVKPSAMAQDDAGPARAGTDEPREASLTPADGGESSQSADLFSGLKERAQDDLPEAQSAPSSSDPKTGHELREETARSLRGRGYVIDEDGHGVRISAMSGARGGSDQLSPLEIVGMAAELGGGVQHQTKLQTCSKCQARTPPGETNCQWCGEPFGSPTP